MYITVFISALAYKCLVQKCEVTISRNDNDLKYIASLMLCNLKEYKKLICKNIVHVVKPVEPQISSDILVDGDLLCNALDRVWFSSANKLYASSTVNSASLLFDLF